MACTFTTHCATSRLGGARAASSARAPQAERAGGNGALGPKAVGAIARPHIPPHLPRSQREV
eukprot:3429585-Pleurochrysis_carterae.AAC.1